MADYDGWQTIGAKLGKGGQGTVYKARNPERVRQREDSLRRAYATLKTFDQLYPNHDAIAELADLLVDCGNPDPSKALGALKHFDIPAENSPMQVKAEARLAAEVEVLEALKDLNHPGILRLLHANVPQRFMVTEFHPRGTLTNHLDNFKGKALEALEAFRPLVNAVAKIHERGKIHRDIKTENIFIATDGRLVLGDFGIVFYMDDQRTRLTDTYGERVGSHFWMAPWAYPAVQIDNVKPSLDVFPLGKVLWSMIAGRDGFAYWEYDRLENNLVDLFPDEPAMPHINHILSKCIVREEKNCLSSATDLEPLIDEAIKNVRHVGQKPEDDGPWLCRVCGNGHYSANRMEMVGVSFRWYQSNASIGKSLSVVGRVCDHCQHVEFFVA